MDFRSPNAQLRLRKILNKKLIQARATRHFYCQKDLAKLLDVDASIFSNILEGKERITTNLALRILDRLNVSQQERNAFKASSILKHKGHPRKLTLINESQYTVISEWQYFAVMALKDTKNFIGTPEWISKRLNIPIPKVHEVLGELIRLGYLEVNEKNEVQGTGKNLTTSRDAINVPDSALLNRHLQNFELASNALDEFDPLDCDFSFLTAAVDKRKVPEVKKLIREFRQKLWNLFETGELSDVYTICIQLFPNTQPTDQETLQGSDLPSDNQAYNSL